MIESGLGGREAASNRWYFIGFTCIIVVAMVMFLVIFFRRFTRHEDCLFSPAFIVPVDMEGVWGGPVAPSWS